MGRKEDNIKRATEVMHNRERIRNLAIAAHIDHGKTTLSDNLIAGAGMMSEELGENHEYWTSMTKKALEASQSMLLAHPWCTE